MLKGIKEPTERAPNGQNWNNLSNEVNKVVLDYHPSYKINIQESIVIKINNLINKWIEMNMSLCRSSPGILHVR